MVFVLLLFNELRNEEALKLVQLAKPPAFYSQIQFCQILSAVGPNWTWFVALHAIRDVRFAMNVFHYGAGTVRKRMNRVLVIHWFPIRKIGSFNTAS